MEKRKVFQVGWTEVILEPLWTDMAKEQLSWGFLLRLGIVLTAVCLCVHVYLEMVWQGVPAPQVLVSPTQSSQNPTQLSRSEPVSADPEDENVKRRISHVGTPKKEGLGRRRVGNPSPPRHLHRKNPRWHIDLEPWATKSRSLEGEARRFLKYITTPQVSCTSLNGDEDTQEGPDGAWAVCLDPKYSLKHRIHNKHCRVYSFGLGVDDRSLEESLARKGCEVHCFDPSLQQPHLQQAEMWLHRLSVDWRDPNPAILAQRQHGTTKKLATILNDFGHRQVDVLKADMESAEWKILENLILEGVLDSVGQLLLELHLHWPGFEVAGDDPSVVRYWFSLLKELQRADFRLFRVHSDPAKPRLFLHKNILNASSAYTVGWVNTQWKP